ncbi:MAG: hypothetical protein FWC17_05765, partial [Treponema sp.]|nr:hypothetical protein [Treponema sp.]
MKNKIFILFQLTLLLFFSCGKKIDAPGDPKTVKAAAVILRERPDVVSGFGSLSFVSKVDITSPQEAVIKTLFFREGDFIRAGQLVVLLENP